MNEMEKMEEKDKPKSEKRSFTPEPKTEITEPELNGIDFGLTITFGIGPQPAVKFVLHRNLVENASPVLKASLPPLGGLESKQWNWTLRDADPKVFQFVALDMYNQDWGIPDPDPFAYIDEANDGLSPQDQKMFDDDDLLLVKVWLLAERLVMPHLQNKAMSRLQKRWASYDSKPNSLQRERTSLYKASSNWVKYVYDHTSSGSLLRNFACQHGLLFIDPEDFDELGHRFPKQFLLELARLFAWMTKPVVFKNTFETGHLVGQAMRDGRWEFLTCFVDV